MGARVQASLYHARKRRRNRALNLSMYRTVSLQPSLNMSGPFRPQDYGAPVTFRLIHALGVDSDELFNYGSQLALRVLDTNTYQLTLWGVNYNISARGQGLARLVLSLIPGDRSFRLWDGCGLLFSGNNVDFTGGVWGVTGSSLVASPDLLSKLSVYAYQYPQYYLKDGSVAPVPTSTDLLYNATAVYFKVGMKVPFLED